MTLTFDPRVNACRAIATHCMSTKIGAGSSSGFHFRAWTHRHTHKATDHPNHGSDNASVGN